MYEQRLKASLPAVQERIGRARTRGGHDHAVSIIAVTKGHPATAIRAAVAAGLRDCGENRVAELDAKVEELGRQSANWHLIGHLQRNKVRKALPLFDLLHSVDSLRLAQEISAETQHANMSARVLVQVNASGEASKSGIDITDDVGSGVAMIETVCRLPGLRVEGVMTMAPLVADETVLRTTFARTRRLFDECARQVPSFNAEIVSMGMSNDFEIAIEEGSTMVRLGTILFGERAK